MPQRRTMNVSLPPRQDRFVRDQVSAGRYKTASEVIRDGLRLLEEVEHRRLLETWLYGGLAPKEEDRLPPELKERARAWVAKLVEEGVRSGEESGWRDGPSAARRLRERLADRFRQES